MCVSDEELPLPLHGFQIKDMPLSSSSSSDALVLVVGTLAVSVAELRLVAVLPYLREDHGRVEPEEDAERESHALDHRPCVEPEETQLQGKEAHTQKINC